MIIELYGGSFEVWGYPVIEDNVTRAYATDEDGDVVVLLWPAGEESVNGNVQLIRVE